MAPPLPPCTCPPMATCKRHGLNRAKETAAKKVSRRGRINKASWDQVFREGVLNGIKRERILSQGPQCEACGRVFANDNAAMKGLHLHHAGTQRSLGPRATPDSIADVDWPTDLVLACGDRGRCHEELEGDHLMFSGRAS